jgi:hypothetical protein
LTILILRAGLASATANHEFKQHGLGSLKSLVRRASFDCKEKADFVGWRANLLWRTISPKKDRREIHPGDLHFKSACYAQRAPATTA